MPLVGPWALLFIENSFSTVLVLLYGAETIKRGNTRVHTNHWLNGRWKECLLIRFNPAAQWLYGSADDVTGWLAGFVIAACAAVVVVIIREIRTANVDRSRNIAIGFFLPLSFFYCLYFLATEQAWPSVVANFEISATPAGGRAWVTTELFLFFSEFGKHGNVGMTGGDTVFNGLLTAVKRASAMRFTR